MMPNVMSVCDFTALILSKTPGLRRTGYVGEGGVGGVAGIGEWRQKRFGADAYITLLCDITPENH